MPDWLYLLIAVLVFATLATIFDAELRAERRYCAELKVRLSVTDKELVTLYFGSQLPAEIPVRIRQIVGAYLGLPVEKLRPDDEFAVIFGDFDFSDMVYEIEEEFAVKFNEEELENCTPTIRGLSELVAEKLTPSVARVSDS